MVASCYRRGGNYAAALEKYKWIHQHFPDDIDCKIKNSIELCSFLLSKYRNSFCVFFLIEKDEEC